METCFFLGLSSIGIIWNCLSFVNFQLFLQKIRLVEFVEVLAGMSRNGLKNYRYIEIVRIM